MTTTFVIQNQDGHYLGKQKDWTDGSDRRVIFRCADKVDAINLVFELSSKNTSLRAQYVECDIDDFGNPVVKASDTPLPAAESSEDEAAQTLENTDLHPHISA